MIRFKILMLAKSKLNSIETLVSKALTDMEISHEEFNAGVDLLIIKEKLVKFGPKIKDI